MSKRKPTPPPPSDMPSMDSLDASLDSMAPAPKSKQLKVKKISKQQDNKIANKPIMSYLDPDLVLELDIAQAQLKHKFPHLKGHKMSRSALIEHAVQLMLNDFKANGENSTIVNLLSK